MTRNVPMKLLHDAPLPKESLEEIRRLVPGIEIVAAASPPPRELLAGADVYYTEIGEFDPADAPNLKWMQTNSAATKSVWHLPVMQSNIPVCNASGAYSVAVAEFSIAMLLALTRKITQGCAAQRDHFWPTDYDPWLGVDLFGKTLGIIGYGSIGRQIARLATGFGMTVLACKRRPEQHQDDTYLIPGTGDPEGKLPAAWFGTNQLDKVFSQSDVVIITVPEIPTTVGMIGVKELSALRPHAWLVNVGRGAVIDEAALIAALRANQFAGAALDVVCEEPLPATSPLWELPNLLIMPHVASWTTVQAHRSAAALIENLRRHQAGEPLVNVVDKTLLY